MSTRAFVRRLQHSVAQLMSFSLEQNESIEMDCSLDEGTNINPEHSLLGNGERDGDGQIHRESGAFPSGQKGRTRREWKFLLLASLLMIMTEFAEFLAATPQQQIFLEVACRNHYASNGDASWQDTAGEKCRATSVQSELALVDGWKETFDQLPGIFLSIPYGILADRIGRKPVLLLSQFGILMSDIFVRIICWWCDIFPLRLIWLASFWRIVGGGNQVMGAMIFVILADTQDEENRADAFFKLLAAILISEITATPLSAGLMTKSSWIPMVMSVAILFATIVIGLAFLPETRKDSVKKTKAVNGSVNGSSMEMNFAPHSSTSQPTGVMNGARKAVTFLLARRNVVYLLFSFFAATIGRKAMILLLQFVYKKFGWTFAQASFLISLRGLINLVNNLAILPALTHLLMSPRFGYRLTTPLKDFALSKLLACLLTLGCITIFLCTNIPTLIFGLSMFALGNSFFLTARSLITGLVPADRVGVLYTAIGMVSGVGVLIAGPLLAKSYSIGMNMGESWLGLPYAVAAGLFSLVAIAVWKVRLSRSRLEAVEGFVSVDETED